MSSQLEINCVFLSRLLYYLYIYVFSSIDRVAMSMLFLEADDCAVLFWIDHLDHITSLIEW